MYGKRIGLTSAFLFFLITTICCTPILSGEPYLYIMMWAFSLPFFLYHYDTNGNLGNDKIVKGVAAFVFLNILYRIIGVSDARWGRYLIHLFFFVTPLLMLTMSGRFSRKTHNLLWWLMALVLAFNVADNIYLSIKYPSINTARFQYEEEFLSTINIGGSTFYLLSLFIFNVFFFLSLRIKGFNIVRLISFGIAFLTAVYICGYCNKASVVVYFFISLVLQLIACRMKTMTMFIILSTIIAVLGLFLINLYKEPLVDWILSVSPSKRLSMRLVTLIDIDNEEAAAGTITGRTALYWLSVETWLKSPTNFLFGIGDHFTQSNPTETGIGQHADLLDTLARYGLLGFALLSISLKNIFYYIISLFDEKYKLNLAAIFLIYILCGFSKWIIVPSVGCVLFFMLPLSAWLVNNKNKK